MSATDVRRVVEHNGASAPCLIVILEQFGWRVFNNRRRLSRLKKKIQIAEKKNQPTTALESTKEELSAELDRYDNLLNNCAEAIHRRTGIPSSHLIDVATSTAFTEGEDRDHIYAELRKMDERGVTAELWKALLSLDRNALVSVKLLSSSESSPPGTKTDEFVGSDYAEPSFKSDLASLFGVDRATIARWIQFGELRRTKLASRDKSRKRWTVHQVDEHIREVLKSGDAATEEKYLFATADDLANETMIGCNRKTAMATTFWTEERDEKQQAWRRKHTAKKRTRKHDI